MAGSLIDDQPPGANTPEFTVSEISRGIKRTLETTYGHVRVRGELGRVTFHRNGHCYLDLKDEGGVLAGVIWKSAIRNLDIRPQEGDEVIASGRITTFAGQSKYQLVIENLAYAGEGALLARLERLRKALAAEGLFDESAKRPLPFLPRVIGVVTSPTGAVIRDILHRLSDRFPAHVLVWPVAVQGPQAAPQVAEAIRGFDALAPDGPVPRPDVLIVARGGGSIEDLWGFNDESVVRAAHACTIPLISAVGHETDTTLIDFAADRRAPTPTAAAEMAVPVRADLVATLADFDARRLRAMAQGLTVRRQRARDLARALPRASELIETRRQRLDIAVARLPRPADLIAMRAREVQALAARLPRPASLIEAARRALGATAARLPPPLSLTREARRRLEDRAPRLPAALGRAVERSALRLEQRTARLRRDLVARPIAHALARLAERGGRLTPAARRILGDRRARLEGRARLLATLGYQETLARGYAVVRDADGTVLTRAAGIEAGTALGIEFADGRLSAVAGDGPAAAPPRARSTASSTPSAKPRQKKKKPTGPGSQGSLF